MATPKVFISSTCYDLKYIRENLKYFVKTIGYEPILSEDGSIFFNPTLHTHDACLTEIPNTQMFVLIIGGRHGGKYISSENSITNEEFKKANELGIPVFALVDNSVYNEHLVYRKNIKNKKLDINDIQFPSVDSINIFHFIDEVRSKSVNNALVPFKDFGDIEFYLKQQWAGMMFDFLTQKSGEKRFTDFLSSISLVNQKIEILSEQILSSVGSQAAKLEAILYAELLASEAVRDVTIFGKRPSPVDVLKSADFTSFCKNLGVDLNIDDDDSENFISTSGLISPGRFHNHEGDYLELRETLILKLKENNEDVNSYLFKKEKDAKI